MIDLNTNSEKLDTLDAEIDVARDAVADAYDAVSLAEHKLLIKREGAIFGAKYEEKLTDITAKSKAVVVCEEELNAAMLADSKHKRAQIQLAKAIDHKDTIKEQNFCVRAQMKVFGG